MSRPVIVAIVGPSASGKDSLARGLASFLDRQKTCGAISNTSHLIVSDTTRPQRPNEHDGVDYNFISQKEFDERDRRKEYIETYSYGPQCWRYGTPRWELNAEISVGVFSPSGLEGLDKFCSHAHDIVPVLLDSPKLVRLWRSIKRDKGFKLEHLRRLRQDDIDFCHPDKVLRFDSYIDMRRQKLSVDESIQMVYNILCSWGIIHTT